MRYLLLAFFAIVTIISAYPQKEILRYYDNGNLRFKSYLKDKTVNVISSSSFDIAVLDSTYVSYYENGKIKESGNFKECYYNSGGRLKPVVIYVEKGLEPIEDGIYDGEKNGQWKEYYESGKTKSIRNYVSGISEGLWTYYNEQGALLKKEFYSFDKLIHSMEWSNDGALFSILHRDYKDNDDESGEDIVVDQILEFYPTGELKSERYEYNKNSCNITEYWINGLIKRKGMSFFSNGSGLYDTWDEEGNSKGSYHVDGSQPLIEHKIIMEEDETNTK